MLTSLKLGKVMVFLIMTLFLISESANRSLAQSRWPGSAESHVTFCVANPETHSRVTITGYPSAGGDAFEWDSTHDGGLVYFTSHAWFERPGLYALHAVGGAPLGGQTGHVRFGNTEGWSVSATQPPSADLWVPYVRRSAGARSVIAIQNTDLAEHATVTIELVEARGWAAPGNTPATQLVRVIPPGRSTLVDLGVEAGRRRLAPAFTGSAHVTSTKPVVAEHLTHRASTQGPFSATSGRSLDRFASHLTAPALMRSASYGSATISTAIALLNPGEQAVDVSIDYVGLSANCAGQEWRDELMITAGGTVLVDQRTGPIAVGCTAHGIIEGSGAVAADVVVETEAGAIAAYQALTELDASATQVARLFSAVRWTSAYFLTNPGSDSATIRLRPFVRRPTGNSEEVPCGECTLTLEAHAGARVWLPDLTEIPADAYGSLYLESSVPVMAIGVDVPGSDWVDLTAEQLCLPPTEPAQTDAWVPMFVGEWPLHGFAQVYLPSVHAPPPK